MGQLTMLSGNAQPVPFVFHQARLLAAGIWRGMSPARLRHMPGISKQATTLLREARRCRVKVSRLRIDLLDSESDRAARTA